MAQQYIRKVSLLIGSDAGDGLDLSELHLNFAVWSSTAQTLRHARIRVYNASDETVQRIQNEFTRVVLQAGYDGNFGLIFSGTVAQYSRGRESATDTYLDIVAQDSDQAYNYAVMNTTLAKGWNSVDYYKSLLSSFAPYGITAGYSPWQGNSSAGAPTQADIDAMQAKVDSAKAAADANLAQQSDLLSQAITARKTGDSYTASGDGSTARSYYLQARDLLNQSGALTAEANNSLIPQYQRLKAQLDEMKAEFTAASVRPTAAAAGTVLPRGKVCYGMTRDYMRSFATATGTRWYFKDGQMHVIPMNGYLPNEAVVLRADTGMIGMPIQTLDGVVVRCLMNSNIITGGRIKIDNASITQTKIVSPQTTNVNDYNLPSLSNDGVYVVYSITHAGDTRGNAWETQMVCFNQSDAPRTATFTNAVIDGQQGTN